MKKTNFKDIAGSVASTCFAICTGINLIIIFRIIGIYGTNYNIVVKLSVIILMIVLYFFFDYYFITSQRSSLIILNYNSKGNGWMKLNIIITIIFIVASIMLPVFYSIIVNSLI